MSAFLSNVIATPISLTCMPRTLHTALLARKISDFCRLRLDPVLPPQESAQVKEYLLKLIARSRMPPCKPRGYDWGEIATQCGLDHNAMRTARNVIEHALDAIVRYAKETPSPAIVGASRPANSERPQHCHQQQRTAKASTASRNREFAPTKCEGSPSRKQPGVKPRAIEKFPKPLFDEFLDPPTFQEALEFQMRRHGDSYWHLHRAVRHRRVLARRG